MTAIISAGQSAAGAVGEQHQKNRVTRIPEYELVLLSGRANEKLADDMTARLGIEPLKRTIKSFADGEIWVELAETVHGKDAYIVQSLCPNPEQGLSVNDSLQELCITIQTATMADAREITVVLPYHCYARQDRKKHGREPISARVAARQILGAGRVRRIVTLDLHTAMMQGYYDDLASHHFYATQPMTAAIRSRWLSGNGNIPFKIVSPDIGGAGRARAYARKLDLDIAIVDKWRSKGGDAEPLDLIGSVRGAACIVADDMIDTAGTLTSVAEFLLKKGAVEVYAAATHALLSGPAVERLVASPIKEILLTDSIPIAQSKWSSKFVTVTTADLLAEAVYRCFFDMSLMDMIGWHRDDD